MDRMDTPLLLSAKTVAIVGLSNDNQRPSYLIARYLKQEGYRIIPVNPNVESVLEEKSYPSVSAIPRNIRIDIIDIFRKSEFVPAIVKDVLKRKEKPIIWMQEGVISEEAKHLAEAHGHLVMMNTCIMKEHQKLFP